jgi:hypothetical protein
MTHYCRRHGFQAGGSVPRVLALCFPVGCVAVRVLIGLPALIGLCVALLTVLVFGNRHRVAEYLATRNAR